MRQWARQLESMATALLLIERLPADAVWSMTVTNDDTDTENMSVLNIYAPRREWAMLIMSLRLINPTDQELSFRSYQIDGLLVSIIDQEEETPCPKN